MTIQEMLDELGSISAVARSLGCSRSTVRRWMNERPLDEVDFTPGSHRGFKRVLAIGDLHSGHYAGLTPTLWHTHWAENAPERFRRRGEMQEEAWNFYHETVKSLGKIDLLIVNGDAIDGKGKRSGGTELITSSTTEQADIAIQCLSVIPADKIVMTHGTGYHCTADGEECEDLIARELGATIEDHAWASVNGCVFDIKHHLGSSSVPYGRATQLSKEAVWNRLWNEIEGAPKGNVFIRSHVHYHLSVTDSDTYLAMTLPPLQAPETRFGAQRCSGVVNFGMVHFDVPNRWSGDIGDIKWRAHLKRLQACVPQVQEF